MKKRFKIQDLKLVRKAHSPIDFKIFDEVELNSGGPRMIIVDIKEDNITTLYKNENIFYEDKFDRRCLKYF